MWEILSASIRVNTYTGSLELVYGYWAIEVTAASYKELCRLGCGAHCTSWPYASLRGALDEDSFLSLAVLFPHWDSLASFFKLLPETLRS